MRVKNVRAAAARLKKDTQARKKRFAAAHAKGMKALKEHDFPALDDALVEERTIVSEGSSVAIQHRDIATIIDVQMRDTLERTRELVDTLNDLREDAAKMREESSAMRERAQDTIGEQRHMKRRPRPARS